MISTTAKLWLLSGAVSAVIYGGHIGIEEAKALRNTWLDSQMEPYLQRKLSGMKLQIGYDKNNNPVLQTPDKISCADWQSAAILYKLEAEQSRTSVQSIVDYGKTYLVQEN